MAHHPLDPIVQSLSGAEPGSSRTQHIKGLRRRINEAKRFGAAPTQAGMEKWFERTTLPTKWLLCLRSFAEQDGLTIDFPEPVVRKGTTDGHADAADAAAA